MSSILAKLAEHLVKNSLERFIESNYLLSSCQYDFRKEISTINSKIT